MITRLVPSSEYGQRSERVSHVVLHHAATTSLAAIERLMEPGGRTVSAHYAVKDDQRVLKVPLTHRAFSLASKLWDSKAVTVECANESAAGWTISARSHETLAQIVADTASDFGFYPHRDGAPSTWTVLGHREVYTIHGASYPTACPGAMDLDGVTRRAQQILAGTGAPPIKPATPMPSPARDAWVRSNSVEPGAPYWPVGPLMVRIQRALKARGRYAGPDDGEGAENTAKGIQITLNRSGRNGGVLVPNGSLPTAVDGLLGRFNAYGIQEYARDFGDYDGPQDGDPRERSWAAFALGLERP